MRRLKIKAQLLAPVLCAVLCSCSNTQIVWNHEPGRTAWGAPRTELLETWPKQPAAHWTPPPSCELLGYVDFSIELDDGDIEYGDSLKPYSPAYVLLCSEAAKKGANVLLFVEQEIHNFSETYTGSEITDVTGWSITYSDTIETTYTSFWRGRATHQ